METTAKGRLKIFLGYASGTGKSYKMMSEACRRRERGQDVVVGATQPKTPPEVEELLKTLEVIPMKLDSVPAMDLAAILQRHPQICIVDGLAYDNPPGSRNAHRWQDVEELLNAGITVVASVNLQHIDQQRNAVKAITGKRAVQTIPQTFLESADEIELVDAPYEETLPKAGTNKDRALQLCALRRMALVLAADVVDAGLRRHLKSAGSNQNWRTHERILVCIAPGVDGDKIIRTGRQVADRFHGDLIVAHVRHAELSVADAAGLEKNLKIARSVQAQIEILKGRDPIQTIVEFAQRHSVTQILVGHSRVQNWRTRLFGTSISRLVRDVPGIDVRVFPI